MNETRKEEIAIIGIGCRFPGANNAEDFWHKVLKPQKDCIQPSPKPVQLRDDSDPTSISTRQCDIRPQMAGLPGGYIDDIAAFDHTFFNISPKEAAALDPQQRQLLMSSWEALEMAGISLDRVDRSRAGVYIGISSHDYHDLQLASCVNSYTNTGCLLSMTANRISYFLGFEGPSIAVDTACSSSLMAVHMAAEAISRGEIDVAVVGGASMLISSQGTAAFDKASMLNKEDHLCKTFDASASGYIRGEGAGIAVMKSHRQAIKDGDRVISTVCGSAINHGGRSPRGLTVPNEESQVKLIQEVLNKAHVAPAQVGYFEAHGTGTSVGDPIEANAIGRTLSSVERGETNPLVMGSVKTNIGHLEAGAGMAALIKVCLMMEHGGIPGNLHFKHPNPQIHWDRYDLHVPTEYKNWPAIPGYACINSFGIGGSNACLCLKGSPGSKVSGASVVPPAHDLLFRTRDGSGASFFLPLSARSMSSLKHLAQRFVDLIRAAETDQDVFKVCAAAAHRRTHLEVRAGVIGYSREHLIERLESFAANRDDDGDDDTVTGTLDSDEIIHRRPPHQLCFVFSGQGSQHWGMAQELLHHRIEPFYSTLLEIDQIFKSLAPFSIIEQLSKSEQEAAEALENTAVAQPAIFGVQLALYELWKSIGIIPEVIVGHSIGEIAAFCAAGVLSQSDAVFLIYHRSRLQSNVSGGKMLACKLTAEQAQDIIDETTDGVISIAATNGPKLTVISGDAAPLERIQKELSNDGVFAKFVKAQCAFHSHHMDAIKDQSLDLLREKEIPHHLDHLGQDGHPYLYSTALGCQINGSVAMAHDSVTYWWRNVRDSVKFTETVSDIVRRHPSCAVFVEVSSHPVLTVGIKHITAMDQFKQRFHGNPAIVLPTLMRNESDRSMMLGHVASLYCNGALADWDCLFGVDDGLAYTGAELPLYPWDLSRKWIISGENSHSSGSISKSSSSQDRLLGDAIDINDTSVQCWESAIDLGGLGSQAFLSDHRVQGNIVFPGAGYIEMALQAAAAMSRNSKHGSSSGGDDLYLTLADVNILNALILRQDMGSSVIQTSARPDSRHGYTFRMSTKQDNEWTNLARGLIQYKTTNEGNVDLPGLQKQCWEKVDVHAFYQRTQQAGFEYGPNFRCATTIRADPNCQRVLACLQRQVKEGTHFRRQDWLLHPTLLDTCFQMMAHFTACHQLSGIFMPVHIDRLQLFTDDEDHQHIPDTCWAVVDNFRIDSGYRTSVDIRIVDQQGRLWAALDTLTCQCPDISAQPDEHVLSDDLYTWDWIEYSSPSSSSSSSIVPIKDAINNMKDLPPRLKSSPGFKSDLRELCCYLSVHLLNTFHVPLQSGEMIDISRWENDAKRNYIGFLLNLLRSEKNDTMDDYKLVTLEDNQVYRVIKSNTKDDDQYQQRKMEQKWKEMVYKYPLHSSELILLRDIMSHAALYIQGNLSPEEKESSQMKETIAHYRSHSPSLTPVVQTMAGMVRSMADPRRHSTEPVRILELGTSGAVTQYILPHLSETNVSYTIAAHIDQHNASQSAQSAASRFRRMNHSYVKHAVLDIEHIHSADENRGDILPLQSYDIILSDRSFLEHISRLDQFVSAISHLLDDGGVLLWAQEQPENLVEHLVFGTESSWWQSRCDASTWRSVLSHHGMHEVERTVKPEEDEGWEIMAAYKSNHGSKMTVEASASEDDTREERWIILGDTAMGREIEQQLRREGIPILAIDRQPVPPSSVDEFAALLQCQTESNPTHIVHGYSLLNTGDRSEVLDAEVMTQAMEDSCKTFLNLLHALNRLDMLSGTPPHLISFTSGGYGPTSSQYSAWDPYQAPLWGMCRVLRNEFPEVKMTLIDVDHPNHSETIHQSVETALEQGHGQQEEEVAIRNGKLFVPRFMKENRAMSYPHDQWDAISAEMFSRGDADTGLRMFHGPFAPEPKSDEIRVEIRAVGVNFKDTLNLVWTNPELLKGLNEGQSGLKFGRECAGVVTHVGDQVTEYRPGDDVVVVYSGCLKSHATVHRRHVLPFPAPHLTYEEAASMPIVFLTAWWALHHHARIESGEWILVHGGAGGVGQAVIQMGKEAGCRIIATAGSPEKRDFLRGLGVDYVFDSRSLDYGQQIRTVTQQRGVDIVVNSLQGEHIPTSMSLLRDEGRFIELGRADIVNARWLSMNLFERNISFIPFDLSTIIAHKTHRLQPGWNWISEKMERGILSPIPLRVWPISETVTAFKTMLHSKNIGKFVLTLNPSASRSLYDILRPHPLPSPPATFPQHRHPSTAEDGVYVISGGLRGVGFSMACWMIRNHGISNVALLGRSGELSPANQAAVDSLSDEIQRQIRVQPMQCDVAHRSSLERCLQSIRDDIGPIRGVVHCAVILDDALLADEHWEHIAATTRPKIMGGIHLHNLTRQDALDRFLVLSSSNAATAAHGQANYNAANMFVENLTFARRQHGLPATCINLGPVLNFGIAARGNSVNSLKSQGVWPIGTGQLHHVFDLAWHRSDASPGSMLSSSSSSLMSLNCQSTGQVYACHYEWDDVFDYFYSHLYQTRRFGPVQQLASPLLQEARNKKNSGEMESEADVKQRVTEIVAEILETDISGVNTSKRLGLQGLDSLMGVQLANRLQREFGIKLNVVDLVRSATVTSIVETLCN
eukprot:gb/GECH01001702.1/.p1 GENE.gb/GECH01001702.1/~~gb/GECH01001702.1/.p1  ORF type:complete len:2634 (+),score=416.38 gb/GECH01001702.1/:1-7902(+)